MRKRTSCQHWELGHFGVYRQMVKDDPDLILFLGDYLYEYGPHPIEQARPRRHPTPLLRTLADYRARHALYRSDPALQAAHAAAPWLFTWDDHEVENDYAGLASRSGAATFPALRAAAYRAYFEHQPLRFTELPGPLDEARLYGAVRWGDLATLHLLDDRQYRDPHACLPPGRRTGELVPLSCAELRDPGRTLLGAAQEAWLEHSLTSSTTRWNVVAQQTLLGALPNGDRVWPDGWDGYPAARERLLATLADPRVRNPVVVGGDVHGWWINDLPARFGADRSPAVATEFCGTSVTSRSGIPQWAADAAWFDKPWLRFAQVDRRGYTLVDVGRQRMRVRLRAADDVSTPEPEVTTLAAFVVEDGKAGVVRD